MIFKKTLGFIIGVIIGLQLCGCGSTQLGEVGVNDHFMYKDGWVEQAYQAGLNDTYEACLETIDALGMRVQSKSLTAMGARITAVKDAKVYRFNLRERPMNITSLSIKTDGGRYDKSANIHHLVKIAL